MKRITGLLLMLLPVFTFAQNNRLFEYTLSFDYYTTASVIKPYTNKAFVIGGVYNTCKGSYVSIFDSTGKGLRSTDLNINYGQVNDIFVKPNNNIVVVGLDAIADDVGGLARCFWIELDSNLNVLIKKYYYDEYSNLVDSPWGNGGFKSIGLSDSLTYFALVANEWSGYMDYVVALDNLGDTLWSKVLNGLEANELKCGDNNCFVSTAHTLYKLSETGNLIADYSFSDTILDYEIDSLVYIITGNNKYIFDNNLQFIYSHPNNRYLTKANFSINEGFKALYYKETNTSVMNYAFVDDSLGYDTSYLLNRCGLPSDIAVQDNYIIIVGNSSNAYIKSYDVNGNRLTKIYSATLNIADARQTELIVVDTIENYPNLGSTLYFYDSKYEIDLEVAADNDTINYAYIFSSTMGGMNCWESRITTHINTTILPGNSFIKTVEYYDYHTTSTARNFNFYMRNINLKLNNCTAQSIETGWVGISEIQRQSITVYPNPTTGILRLSGNNNPNLNLQVMDLSGRLITEQTINSDIINLEMLNEGIYLLNFISEDGIISTKKVVIIK